MARRIWVSQQDTDEAPPEQRPKESDDAATSEKPAVLLSPAERGGTESLG
jgi:hypothetical protein